MPHFFAPPESLRNGRFVLEGSEAHHLAAVLRKKAGDEVLLFDGVGGNFRAVLETVSAHRVEGRVVEEAPAPRIPYKLRLFQGMPKGDKFDFILQKITELGAAEIVPVTTERSVTKIPPERLPERMRRWEKIVMSAAKQCGLASVPTVHAPFAFDRAFGLCEKGSHLLFPWEGEERWSLKDALHAHQEPQQTLPLHFPAPAAERDAAHHHAPIYNIFIGPEGGFSSREAELAKKHGAVWVTLGPLILRTETAGLFVASALMYEMGRGTL